MTDYPLWMQIVQKYGGMTEIPLAALEGRIPDEDLQYLSATHFQFQMLRLIWQRLAPKEPPDTRYRCPSCASRGFEPAIGTRATGVQFVGCDFCCNENC